MKKSYLWRKMTSGLMAAAVTVTAMPGLGLTMVQAEEKKTRGSFSSTFRRCKNT